MEVGDVDHRSNDRITLGYRKTLLWKTQFDTDRATIIASVSFGLLTEGSKYGSRGYAIMVAIEGIFVQPGKFIDNRGL